MIQSLAIIVILGLLIGYIFEKIKMPALLGMLLLGIFIGPYGCNLLSTSLMNVSDELRKLALIIILLRAGLGLSKDKLKQVGRPALFMSFLPGIFEGMVVAIIAVYIFNISYLEGGILGFIIAAVSPAVVVPFMLKFSEEGYGTNKNIPTLILAGASVDDVVAITIFSSFLGIYSKNNINITRMFFSIPFSIIFGIILGVIFGLVLVIFFRYFNISNTKKVLMFLSVAVILNTVGNVINQFIPIASLLGVMTMGLVIFEKKPKLAKNLSSAMNIIWVLAEIILFVLVGAQVNISVAFDSGLLGIFIIIIGLMARSLGVWISLIGTNLNFKERLFCVISYTPKATVQAAIGAIPLSVGVASGELILAIAVLSVLITAPCGAVAMRYFAPRFLLLSDEY